MFYLGNHKGKSCFGLNGLWIVIQRLYVQNLLKLQDRIDGSTYQAFFPVAKGLCFQLNIKRKFPLWEQSNTGEQLHREVVKSQPNCSRIWTTCSCRPCFEPTGCITYLQRYLLASPLLCRHKTKFGVLITSLISSSPHSLKQESQDQCKKRQSH